MTLIAKAMLQIELLLSTLTEPELERLKAIQLRGKQREVLHRLIRESRTGGQVRAKDVAISSNHFFQIAAVLLQKCYRVLARGGLLELATFLVSKNLTKLLYRQLKLLEVHIKGASHEKQESFYGTAFEIAQWVVYDDLDYDLVRYFGDRYLQLKDADAGESLFVEIRILRNAISELYTASTREATNKEHLKQRLEHYRSQINSSLNGKAHYHLHCAFYEYYILIENDPYAALAHLQASTRFVNAVPEQFQDEERNTIAAQRADLEYVLGNYQTAYRMYMLIWSEHRSSMFVRRNFYHTIRYAELATIVGKRENAISIVTQRIDRGNDNLFKCNKLLLQTALSLLDHNVDHARELIEKTYKYNSGRSYGYVTEVRTRFLEVACAYLSKDWQYASALITRSLQFIQRNKNRVINKVFADYFKVVFETIRFHETGRPVRRKVIDRCSRKGHHRFVSLVLDEITRPGRPGRPPANQFS